MSIRIFVPRIRTGNKKSNIIIRIIRYNQVNKFDIEIDSRMDNQGRKIIVCDNGTGFIKCGYAGSNFPLKTFPSLVGRPIIRAVNRIDGIEVKDLMVGDEANKLRSLLELSYPMENGIVRNWEDMCHVWDYTFFEKMQIDPTECKILLTDPPMNPISNRRKMLETMFEKYGFHSAYIAIQAVLTLYAQGKSTTDIMYHLSDNINKNIQCLIMSNVYTRNL